MFFPLTYTLAVLVVGDNPCRKQIRYVGRNLSLPTLAIASMLHVYWEIIGGRKPAFPDVPVKDIVRRVVTTISARNGLLLTLLNLGAPVDVHGGERSHEVLSLDISPGSCKNQEIVQDDGSTGGQGGEWSIQGQNLS